MTYNYWLTILALIKLGIPYDSVLSFTEDEISVILGVQSALEQREADEQMRKQRQAEQREKQQNMSPF